MAWTRAEANRTIDEVKRRSLIDPEFRALAMSDAKAAIAKVNPKLLPPGVLVKFVQAGAESGPTEPGMMVVVLPDLAGSADDLSDAELEQAVGGTADIKLPDEWVPPQQ